MEITEKDIKRIALILLILILGVLVFLILRPIILSIIAGLILAYVFMPVYNLSLKYVKSKTLSASLVSIFALSIIIVPLWYAIPAMIEQVFEVFKLTQGVNIQGFLLRVLPNMPEQITAQLSLTVNSALSGIASSILNSLVDFLLDFPKIALHIILVAFVFFFTLRDKEELKEFVSGLSPLNKNQEKSLIKQFKGITESIVYGQILIGLLQALFAGIGYFLFGVENALLLTVLTAVFSIIPFVGPSIVYLPVFFYLLVTSNNIVAVGFLLYNLLIVSSIDNLARALLVSVRTNLSQVIVLIGMIGGFFIFGVLGLLLGPLIMAYFITLLRAYKERNLSSLFG